MRVSAYDELENYRATRSSVIDMAKRGSSDLKKYWSGEYTYNMDLEDLVAPDLPPFQHKDIQHVQMNISLAKQLKEGGNTLAAVLICINIVDYIAEFIANGLAVMNIEAMSKYYLGNVLYTPKKPEEFTINDSMKYIRNYDFAGKEKLMTLLGQFNKDRNHIAHKIVKNGGAGAPDVDKKINEIFILTDKIINIANTLQSGFPPPNVVERFENNK